MNKILIVKTSAIGDIIHAFPVVSYLKMRYPKVSIHWIAERACIDLIRAHPLIDQAIEMDTRSWKKQFFSASTWKALSRIKKRLKEENYDLVIDLQGNSKSALFTSWAKAKAKLGFAWQSVPELPNLLVTNHRFNVSSEIDIQSRYLSIVQQYFEDHAPFAASSISLNLSAEESEKLEKWLEASKNRLFKVMVCFGSKWPNKKLPERTLIEFLKQIQAHFDTYFYIIWGNQEEKQVAERLSVEVTNSETLGNLTLPLWQNIMRHVDLVIAMDSAALHLCASTQTPSFSLFGPSSSKVYKPIGERHHSFQGRCPYNQAFEARCPYLRSCKTGRCMGDMEAKELFLDFNIFWTALLQNLEIRSS